MIVNELEKYDLEEDTPIDFDEYFVRIENVLYEELKSSNIILDLNNLNKENLNDFFDNFNFGPSVDKFFNMIFDINSIDKCKQIELVTSFKNIIRNDIKASIINDSLTFLEDKLSNPSTTHPFIEKDTDIFFTTKTDLIKNLDKFGINQINKSLISNNFLDYKFTISKIDSYFHAFTMNLNDILNLTNNSNSNADLKKLKIKNIARLSTPNGSRMLNFHNKFCKVFNDLKKYNYMYSPELDFSIYKINKCSPIISLILLSNLKIEHELNVDNAFMIYTPYYMKLNPCISSFILCSTYNTKIISLSNLKLLIIFDSLIYKLIVKFCKESIYKRKNFKNCFHICESLKYTFDSHYNKILSVLKLDTSEKSRESFFNTYKDYYTNINAYLNFDIDENLIDSDNCSVRFDIIENFINEFKDHLNP